MNFMNIEPWVGESLDNVLDTKADFKVVRLNVLVKGITVLIKRITSANGNMPNYRVSYA